jgi:hypothetical protein
MPRLSAPPIAVAVTTLLATLGGPLQSQSAPDSTASRHRIQPFPALGSAPETGLQFGATVLAVFEPAPMRHARPASIVPTAIRTTKGQTRLSLEGEYWAANNARRLQGLIAWQKFPLAYYGIGNDTPESAKEIYTPTGTEASFTVQQRLRGAWYALGGARVLNQSIVADADRGVLRTGTITGFAGGQVTEVSAGLLRDSRDVVFNPARGTFAQATVARSLEALGSEFSYTRLRIDARRYTAVRGEHILAVHAQLIGTSGRSIPFDQLALVGGGDMLRGYTRGRYRDRWLAAAQAEYRSPIRHRLGAVIFAGAGRTAWQASDLTNGALLPTYGTGLRFQIDARQRTAIRADYGRGRDGASGVYIGFNQAF